MTAKDKYGQCTEDGCRRMIGELHGLDAGLTVGEIRSFLEKRTKETKDQRTAAFEETVRELSGKCFKFRYNNDLVVYVKVTQVVRRTFTGWDRPRTSNYTTRHAVEIYGTNDAVIKGESLTLSIDGQVRHEILFDKKYSQYDIGNTETVEVAEFDAMKAQYQALVAILNKK